MTAELTPPTSWVFYFIEMKKFKGVWLESKLWGIGLDSDSKILYQKIKELCQQPEGCYASDEYLSFYIENCRISTNEKVKKLEKLGLINTIKIREGKKWKRKITIVESSHLGLSKKVESSHLGLPKHDSINKEEETNKISDGALNKKEKEQEKETQPVSDGAPGEIEITSQVKTRFKNSKAFRIYLNEYQYYYKNFINFFQIDPEEKFSQHEEKYLNWMLDKFIESRKKKNSKKELLQQKSS